MSKNLLLIGGCELYSLWLLAWKWWLKIVRNMRSVSRLGLYPSETACLERILPYEMKFLHKWLSLMLRFVDTMSGIWYLLPGFRAHSLLQRQVAVTFTSSTPRIAPGWLWIHNTATSPKPRMEGNPPTKMPQDVVYRASEDDMGENQGLICRLNNLFHQHGEMPVHADFTWTAPPFLKHTAPSVEQCMLRLPHAYIGKYFHESGKCIPKLRGSLVQKIGTKFVPKPTYHSPTDVDETMNSALMEEAINLQAALISKPGEGSEPFHTALHASAHSTDSRCAVENT